MKLFIVAGEASGDMHAANLVKEIRIQYPDAQFEGWGGNKMKSAGVIIHKHIKELAFMGFVEVLRNLRTILKNFGEIKNQIAMCRPDAVILIDYPGFNLRLAPWLKQSGFKVIYYIAPQVWAWKENRVQKLKKYTDKILCILPFEKAFFAKHEVEVDYVGHPLLEQIQPQAVSKENIIALLPGSRAQEVKAMLPKMLSIITDFPTFDFFIAKSPNLDADVYSSFLSNERVKLFDNGVGALLSRAQYALVTSGTATLETALYKVPQIVCYKSGSISYQIAKRVIKVPYISLVNLIANKEVVKELIQDDLSREQLVKELSRLMQEGNKQSMLANYNELAHQLGDGTASKKAATVILNYLNNNR